MVTIFPLLEHAPDVVTATVPPGAVAATVKVEWYAAEAGAGVVTVMV